MAVARYIRHLTIDTGDQRDSYRDEVADSVVEMLRPLIDRAVAGERVQVPGDVDPDCTMTAARGRDRALVVTVWGPPQMGLDVPMVTIGVAPSSLASAAIWLAWFGISPPTPAPPSPWCAARLLPGLTIYPQAAGWLGDLERCIAWAWIEGVRR